MAHHRSLRALKKSRRSDGEARLNITSMMDMFTIILVFLLKSFSTQGQLVTPATGLVLPTSTVTRPGSAALNVQISENTVSVEERIVLDSAAFASVLDSEEFLIEPLHGVLKNFAEEAQKGAEKFGKPFSGEISIQGDVDVPYKVLTRIMYTCGQAGYPVMNLMVYRKE